MKKVFEEYGGVIGIVLVIAAIVSITFFVMGGKDGGTVGGSLKEVVSEYGESMDKAPQVTPMEKTDNFLIIPGADGDRDVSTVAYDATIVDFDSSYDTNKKIVYIDDELVDNTTGEPKKNVALDLSANKDGSVVGYYEYRGNERVFVIAGKDGPVMAPKNCCGLFRNCNDLKVVRFGKSFNTSNVLDMSYMFAASEELREVDLSSLDVSSVTDMSYMFQGCTALKTVNMSGLNAEKVQNVVYMFNNCSNLETLNLTGFITGEALTNMSRAFMNCKSLKTLDMSSFNTSKVTNVMQLFQGCESLETIDTSSFTFESLKAGTRMFANCKSLKALDLSKFKSNFSGMAYMFTNCSSLTELDLSNFNTANTTTMASMFSGCTSLKTLNLSSFNTAKRPTVTSMFKNCSSLETVIISEDWDVSSSTTTTWLDGCSLAIPTKYEGESVITTKAA